jgi:hypothetical protein
LLHQRVVIMETTKQIQAFLPPLMRQSLVVVQSVTVGHLSV